MRRSNSRDASSFMAYAKFGKGTGFVGVCGGLGREDCNATTIRADGQLSDGSNHGSSDAM